MNDAKRRELKDLELELQLENGDHMARTTAALESIAMSLVHLEKDNRTIAALEAENAELIGERDNLQATVDEHLGSVIETRDKVKAHGGASDPNHLLRLSLEESQVKLRKSKVAEATARVEADTWMLTAKLVKACYLEPHHLNEVEIHDKIEKEWRGNGGNVMTWSAALERYNAFVVDVSPVLKQGRSQAELEDSLKKVEELEKQVKSLQVEVMTLDAAAKTAKTMSDIASNACRHWRMMLDLLQYNLNHAEQTIKPDEEFAQYRERLRKLWLKAEGVTANDWTQAVGGHEFRMGQTDEEKDSRLINREKRQAEMDAAEAAAESAAERTNEEEDEQ